MSLIADHLAALTEVLDLAQGRIPAEAEARARAVLAHAPRRLAAGAQTVVAIAGATGSGKSSLFNALTGTRLAEQGPRRPTTALTMAASFSATNSRLLDLLAVARRHEVEPPAGGMQDLILLDLPDHDSTATAHRDEVDRLVALVDQFTWVLDPQKYADAALHQRYLRPLARHREVITVVLNQADKLSPEDLARCLAHIRRLLDDDGLHGVPILATSAVTGMGIDDLRGRLAKLATGKRAATTRLQADAAVAARELDAAMGRAVTRGVSKDTVQRLNAQLSAAAGVPIVVDAVRNSVKHRGRLATGWPLVKWIGRLKPDPLKRLRLGVKRGAAPAELEPPGGLTRSSLPARSAAASSHLSTGLRGLANELGDGMPAGWRDAISRAVHTSEATLPDQLDRAVVATDLKVDRTPVWWQLIRALQWVLIVAVVAGALWLTLNVVLSYFGLPKVDIYPVGPDGGLQLPVPTLMVIGGVVAGIVLSGLSGLAISAAAKGAAKRARKALNASVAEVGSEHVVAPAEAEVQRYVQARSALDRLS
ncbi:50S ribosome-binding GTPase [Tessaracoccus sp. MC1865]|uniref:GTPase n=1 Tax=unclassified Tessaracoccus TaxID=2635419 RepID=UPI001603EC8A|nr:MULTISPECIES: GTPase [unclassified Tessaracoccus]MBB1484435.1 50S ribosome-binding GTPase [Tessaracoccus sp. MC1865]MBB1509299.1 50S ribosome-binding GTPase [Tessaracoccus sp. MC1756]QTO38460.1 50S ribosome-binding GTPase [Tessaracoccus sp. MC1865]